MTWKELRYQIENAVDNNGVDVEAQPIVIKRMEIHRNDSRALITVETSQMPHRCVIDVIGTQRRSRS